MSEFENRESEPEWSTPGVGEPDSFEEIGLQENNQSPEQEKIYSDDRRGYAMKFLDAYKAGQENFPSNEKLDEEKETELNNALKFLNDPSGDIKLAEDVIAKIIKNRGKKIQESIRFGDPESKGTADEKIIEYIAMLTPEDGESGNRRENLQEDRRTAVFDRYLESLEGISEEEKDKLEVLREQIKKAKSDVGESSKASGSAAFMSLPLEERKKRYDAMKKQGEVRPEVKPTKPLKSAESVNPKKTEKTTETVKKEPKEGVAEEPVEAEERDFEKEMRGEKFTEFEATIEEQSEKFGDLSDESRVTVDSILSAEAKGVYREFAVKWIADKSKRGELKDLGVSAKGMDDDAKFMFVFGDEKLKRQALADLKENNDQYGKYGHELDRLADLMKDCEKKKIPIETQFILVNKFEKISKRLEKEAAGADEKTKAEILKSLDSILKVQQEVIEKAMNISLDTETTKDAQDVVGLPKDVYVSSKMSYTENKMAVEGDEKVVEKILLENEGKYHGDKSKLITEMLGAQRFLGIDQDQAFALLHTGYSIDGVRGPGFIDTIKNAKRIIKGEEMVVVYKDGERMVVSTRELKDIAGDSIKSRKQEIKSTAEKQLSEEWEKGFQEEKKKALRSRISGFAKTSEKAEGKTEGVYDRMKNRLVAEFLDGVINKERTPEELKVIKKEFGSKKRVDIVGFINQVYNREAGELGVLTGEDIDGEVKTISSFFGACGIKIGAAALKKIVNPAEYKKALGSKKGFVDYLLNIIVKQNKSVK